MILLILLVAVLFVCVNIRRWTLNTELCTYLVSLYKLLLVMNHSELQQHSLHIAPRNVHSQEVTQWDHMFML